MPVQWWQVAKEPSPMPDLNNPAEPMPPGAFYSLKGGKLGVSRIRSDEDLALLVEQRLPATAIRSLVRGGMSDSVGCAAQNPGAPHRQAPAALQGRLG
jgi:hypothetical protein